jgi:uncharacterized lipoprotein YmbA
MRFLNVAAVLIAMMSMLAGGCSTSPRASFYTLSPMAPSASSSSESAPVAVQPPPLRVMIDAITVPELVERPQFVLRTGATQVTIDEFARWADPLRSQISRVLAANLSQLLPGALVSGYAQGPEYADAYRVRVDVQSFESAPGDLATIVVLWSVRPPKGATTSGRTIAHEVPRAAGYDALVDAHSRALAKVSGDIASAIRSTLRQ